MVKALFSNDIPLLLLENILEVIQKNIHIFQVIETKNKMHQQQ